MITEKIGFFTVTRNDNWEEERNERRKQREKGVVYMAESSVNGIVKIGRAMSLEMAHSAVSSLGPNMSMFWYCYTENTRNDKEIIKKMLKTEKDWLFITRDQRKMIMQGE